MRIRRYLLTCGALTVVALLWNGFVHLVVLRSARAAVAHLLRPDFQQKSWLSVLVTVGMIALFVWGYGRFVRGRLLADGARCALFFGLLTGLLVDLNQYVLYPIPAWVAAAWFVGGLIEFQLYALLIGAFLPPPVD